MPDYALRGVEEASMEARYEVSDANAKALAFLGVSIVIVGAMIFALLAWVFHRYVRDLEAKARPRTVLIQPGKPIPGPRLQLSPRADLERFESEKLLYLNSKGELPGEPGWVHIPIEDAMRQLAQESQGASASGGGGQ